MEKYKKGLKKRLALAGLNNALLLLLIALGVFHMTAGSNEHIRDYISGFNLGLCLSVEIVALFHTSKYHAAMKNEDTLKQLYIAENDERRKYINEKIGGMGQNLVICGLALGTIVSGYINETVFFALLGALLFTVVVKAILKFYYSKVY